MVSILWNAGITWPDHLCRCIYRECRCRDGNGQLAVCSAAALLVASMKKRNSRAFMWWDLSLHKDISTCLEIEVTTRRWLFFFSFLSCYPYHHLLLYCWENETKSWSIIHHTSPRHSWKRGKSIGIASIHLSNLSCTRLCAAKTKIWGLDSSFTWKNNTVINWPGRCENRHDVIDDIASRLDMV